MQLKNCRKCFHHMDCAHDQVVCRFWGANLSRRVEADIAGPRVLACPRIAL